MRNLIKILTILVTLALLSACGGSGSSSSTTPSSSPSISSTQSVSLSWVPPTTRADGTALNTSDLAGYRIYMGTSRDNLDPLIDLLNDDTNEFEVSLARGSYYFAISTYDHDGVESPLSELIFVRLS